MAHVCCARSGVKEPKHVNSLILKRHLTSGGFGYDPFNISKGASAFCTIRATGANPCLDRDILGLQRTARILGGQSHWQPSTVSVRRDSDNPAPGPPNSCVAWMRVRQVAPGSSPWTAAGT